MAPMKIALLLAAALLIAAAGEADQTLLLGNGCETDRDCGAGEYCSRCLRDLSPSKCIRSTATNLFQIVNKSLPFNKYAFLTTHNSFAIDGEPPRTGVPRLAPTNQEDKITQQLNNGVRVLMLDTYDFKGEIWLCHSLGGICLDVTAFEPMSDAMKEVETFLKKNPSEIVTLILEDYVDSEKGLTNVFKQTGLNKYMFPLSKMPKNGQNWPLVKDMIAANQRLVVFTSRKVKETTEGIAYQWNYMVENQYGDDGMKAGFCDSRGESSQLNDKTKSLVLMNYFTSKPTKSSACVHNSQGLLNMVHTCHKAAGNRWPNFIAVDFYKRSEGGGAFEAVDTSNGELICGRDDIHRCRRGKLQEDNSSELN